MRRLTDRKWTAKDNTQPTVELVQCAHCDGSAEIRFQDKKVRVVCKRCGISTPLFDFQTQAVACWNRRV